MATTTTRLVLRKPDPTPATGDFVSASLDLNANWDKVDAAVGAIACTSGARPGSPYNGQFARETDTGNLILWNGAAWIRVFMEGQARFGAVADLGRTNASDLALTARLNADSQNRFALRADGRWDLGPGNAALDWSIARSGASTADITGNLNISGYGPGRIIKRGNRTTDPGGITTETGILRVDGIAYPANHLFLIQAVIRPYSSVSSDSYAARIRVNTAGNATTGSTQIGHAEQRSHYNAWPWAIYQNAGAQTLSVLLSINRAAGTGTFNANGDSGTGGINLMIWDLGIDSTDTGVDV